MFRYLIQNSETWRRFKQSPLSYVFVFIFCFSIIGLHNWYLRVESPPQFVGSVDSREMGVPSVVRSTATASSVSVFFEASQPAKNNSPPLQNQSVRNLSELVQSALISDKPEIKAQAIVAINFCKNFTGYAEQMREVADLNNSKNWPAFSRQLDERGAECQTLSAHDMSWVKQLATDAYKLGGEAGAYLYAKEVGIPEDAAERKAWLQALKAAAYEGHALSQIFVDKRVGEMFEDRDESYGFQMASLRGSQQLASLPDHALFPIVSLELSYHENSASVRRAIEVMKRLREARDKRTQRTALGQ